MTAAWTLRIAATAQLAWLAGCSRPTPSHAPDAQGAETRSEVVLSDATAVAAGDLDGDGFDEVVLIEAGTAHWTVGGQDLSLPVDGAVQAVARGDVDGDGRDEVLIATGASRGTRSAPQALWSLDDTGGTQLWRRDGPRNQVTDLAVVAGRAWVAAFTDERRVEGGFLEHGTLKPVVVEDLALRMVPIGDTVAIGRLYGDEPKSDGDLRLRPMGALADRTRDRVLPSLRGVRALAAADLDGDGAPELLVGDGWHAAYGAEADPRLQLFAGPRFAEGRTIAWLDGDYAVEHITTVPGDSIRLLVTGSGSVRLLWRDALGWAARTLSQVSETGNAVVVNGPDGPAALISGRPARLVAL